MTQRERKLFWILGGVVVVVVGFFLVVKWFRDPLNDAKAKARAATADYLKLSGRWTQLQQGEKKLEKWRKIGLSSNLSAADSQYYEYLQHELLKNSKLDYSKVESLSDGAKRNSRDRKQASHSTLSYGVNAKGKLHNFVKFLHDFYATELPHRIKELRVDRYSRRGESKDPELSIAMQIDVLVVHPEKGKEPKLIRKVDVKGFQKTGETIDKAKLMQLAKLNIFQGHVPPPPPPPKKVYRPKIVKKRPPPKPRPKPGFDFRPYMQLTSINLADEDIDGFPGTYATVRNKAKPVGSDDVYTNLAVRDGYDIVQIMDEKEVEMQLLGRVLLVDFRDVYIQQWGDDDATTLLAGTVGLSHSPLPCAPLLPASMLMPGRLNVYKFHIGDNLKNAMESPVDYRELWKDGIAERMAEAARNWSGPSESTVTNTGAE